MFDPKRLLTTVLGFGALVLSAHVTTASATPAPQLVITSATFDEANNRLVIAGQNFSWPSNGSGHATPPVVSLDLLPLTVLSATSTQIVASLSGTFPDGTYLITVSRGQGAVDSGAFAVAIYHEQAPQGGQGSVGPAGPAGPAGPQGPAGLVGAMGPSGPAGAVGPAGSAGAIGSVGPAGAVGPAGSAGAIGPAGPVGAVGPAGAAGAVGPAGPAGAIGPQGATGATGAIGPEGPAGPGGAAGALGPQGPMGASGPAGPQGVAGPQGTVGPQGVAGLQGPAGPQGLPGVSGYQIITATNTGQLAAGKFMNATAVCPAGTHVLGGGGLPQTPLPSNLVLVSVVWSYPDTNQSWYTEIRNNSSVSLASATIVAYAVCAITN